MGRAGSPGGARAPGTARLTSGGSLNRAGSAALAFPEEPERGRASAPERPPPPHGRAAAGSGMGLRAPGALPTLRVEGPSSAGSRPAAGSPAA